MRITRIHQVAANVVDAKKTKDFYLNVLGAHFVAEFNPPGLLFFDFSGTRLLFERNNTPASLYFWVDDIRTAYRNLVDRGVNFDSEPHLIHKDDAGVFDNAGTEEWMAFFKDPGNNTLALVSRVIDGCPTPRLSSI